MLEILISGILSFVGTNIDDIFIDTFFFAEADTKQKVRGVVIGKYLGIGALVLLSLIGAFGLQLLPQQFIALLGVIPIGLGVKEWISNRKGGEDVASASKPPKATTPILNVMIVTIANGADNIGVYIPLFASLSTVQWGAVVCLFAVMIAVWCVLGKKLSDLPFLRRFLQKYKHTVIPLVYIALGVYIILKNLL